MARLIWRGTLVAMIILEWIGLSNHNFDLFFWTTLGVIGMIVASVSAECYCIGRDR